METGNFSIVNKALLVIEMFWNNRDKKIFLSDVHQELEGKISIVELDTILEQLIDAGTVSVNYLIIDGTETNVLLYTLSFLGRVRVENTIRTSNQSKDDHGLNENSSKDLLISNGIINSPSQASAVQAGQKLKKELHDFRFFELPKVVCLNTEARQKLVAFLTMNEIPYQMAMFDFLDYLSFLEENYCNSRAELFKLIAKDILDCESAERTVKGNYYVLQPTTKEDRDRYTAHNFKEIVRNEYKKLK